MGAPTALCVGTGADYARTVGTVATHLLVVSTAVPAVASTNDTSLYSNQPAHGYSFVSRQGRSALTLDTRA
jgi:hypothetical protein